MDMAPQKAVIKFMKMGIHGVSAILWWIPMWFFYSTVNNEVSHVSCYTGKYESLCTLHAHE